MTGCSRRYLRCAADGIDPSAARRQAREVYQRTFSRSDHVEAKPVLSLSRCRRGGGCRSRHRPRDQRAGGRGRERAAAGAPGRRVPAGARLARQQRPSPRRPGRCTRGRWRGPEPDRRRGGPGHRRPGAGRRAGSNRQQHQDIHRHRGSAAGRGRSRRPGRTGRAVPARPRPRRRHRRQRDHRAAAAAAHQRPARLRRRCGRRLLRGAAPVRGAARRGGDRPGPAGILRPGHRVGVQQHQLRAGRPGRAAGHRSSARRGDPAQYKVHELRRRA